VTEGLDGADGFEGATGVELVQTAGALQRYRAEIHDGWDIGGNANGGYVLAIAGRAMAAATGRPPLSVTAHYLAPAPPGPCEVLVTTVRPGGRLATCTAALVQDGRTLIQVLGTFGEPTDTGLRHLEGAPPDLPPYDACTSRADIVAAGDPGFPASGLMDRLAVRVRPGDLGFATGHPSGRAETAGWFAFVREQPIDEVALLFVADAMAPPVFNLGVTGWVPTVELTVHVRMRPVPGPLRCVFRTRFIEGGTLDEDGEIWDSADQLVAQSRQLALTPRA
jgi:Acyl-CoA thioesterase C-terminal domain/Acyl-CoA thioesterase N-terminal domain